MKVGRRRRGKGCLQIAILGPLQGFSSDAVKYLPCFIIPYFKGSGYPLILADLFVYIIILFFIKRQGIVYSVSVYITW